MNQKPPPNTLYGSPDSYSPITYAPAGMLDRSDHDPVRLRWFADNCEALADFMASLQPGRHEQSTWATQYSSQASKNECGTAACALGWASLSNIIQGLQYFLRTEPDEGGKAYFGPTADGHSKSFEEVGPMFFGYPAYVGIFCDPDLGTNDLIRLLRKQAKEYRS